MLFFTQTAAPILFALTFLWFLVAIVVFLVKFFGAGKLQDPVAKKQQRKQAWRILMYPILFFIVVLVINSFISIASGSAVTH